METVGWYLPTKIRGITSQKTLIIIRIFGRVLSPWDITPCNPLTTTQSRRSMSVVLATWFTLISCLAYSFTLKIEATCASEMSVDFQRHRGVISL